MHSIRNKFTCLAEGIIKFIIILMISETKIDDSFPLSRFLLSNYRKCYKLNRKSSSAGTLIYIRENIPTKKLYSFIKDLKVSSLNET